MKQVFIVLLSFSESLACVDKVYKWLSLNDNPYMIRPTLIDFNSAELKCYPFIVTLDIFNGCCNALSLKIIVPKETKDINVKVFNIIINKNKAKTMAKHTSCDSKCKFNSTTCNSTEKWNNEKCQCECKKEVYNVQGWCSLKVI